MNRNSSHKYSSIRTGEFDDDYEVHGSITQLDKKIGRQNNNLDLLGESVSRLGELSLTISKEIDTQNRYLTDLEQDVEKSQTSAEILTKKTKELVNNIGGGREYCVIAILSMLLILLIVLVMYT